MTKGTMNHLALTVRDLATSEAAFYAPVLGFLGYDKVEDIPETMTLWFNGEAKFAINLWQARPAAVGPAACALRAGLSSLRLRRRQPRRCRWAA